ncbi:hypothetical protein UFOVP1116_43 [uncultured Caudovirales phage]|uniref:Uncharacterized protein n=1 Tax=uncultured Caudovirales phage TaxID=2100421 RepID=A0A6J5S5S7_9CAUD|nr:hypothetical protein UFOVP1116_43 [uncultured Caudovirales phage]CAB4203855.1 hypothetical protein UFOVP1391_13 [uncultured Caudovirales phage]CAB5229669.1 hypothetical protein UFOVP1568_6 [uncultured Caudovirales phage]
MAISQATNLESSKVYAFLRALFDALLSFVSSNVGKGKQAVDADEKPKVLAKTGSRIREYIRLRGMQSSRTGDGSKSDPNRPKV